MTSDAVPRPGWPFLITPGVSAPIRAAVVPAPVEHDPELLLDWCRQHQPIDTASRSPHRVRLPGRRKGWIAYRRVTAGSDGAVRIRDRVGRREIRLTGHTGRVTACAFSSDERLVATGSWDRSLRIWSAVDGTLLTTHSGHGAWVSGVAFAPGDEHVLTTSWDGGVRAFPVAPADRPAATWTMSAPLVTGCAVTPDGHYAVTAGADRLIRVVDLTRPGTAAAMLLDGHRDEITTCVMSPDGLLIVSGSRDRALIVWDAGTGEKRLELHGHRDWVSAAAFSPDGRWLISAGWDGQVLRWELDGSGGRRLLVSHSSVLTGCTVLPRGGTVCTTGADGAFRSWDPEDGRSRGAHEIGSGSPGGCVVSPGGRYVAILSLNDGPAAEHPARDLAGRPIVMTEGVLYLDRPEPSALTDLDLDHLHAISISGLGRYIATESYGGDVTVSQRLTVPGWTL